MTNPDNALGTNGAFGGRTSVNAFNDVLATFDGSGIVSGFVAEPDSGMTVAVGGDGTTRDVAVAEDPFGNRTTVDNISGDPIPVTIDTASTTSARIDSIVAYVNSPANASDTSVDNPTACGIISVNGTSGGAPIDSAIRTAITADGGTGSTAYYVVIANVSVPANTTTITSGLISDGKSINLSATATSGSNGLMSGADKSKLDGIDKTKLDGLMSYSTTEQVIGTWTDGKPLYRRTFSGTGGSTMPLSVANIPNITVRTAYGRLTYNSPTSGNYHQIGAYANANFYSLAQHNSSTGELSIWGKGYDGQRYELTIEYTKNTD
jgi:hypothetical protein